MDFNQYQAITNRTAIYPDVFLLVSDEGGEHGYKQNPASFLYPALGLAEEAGEVVGKIAKWVRDGGGFTTLQEQVKKELGDVLWMVAQVAETFDISLQDVADTNIKKLAARQIKGTLRGSGDER